MNMQPKKIYINRQPQSYRKKTIAEWREEQDAAQRQMALNDQQESSPGCLCFILGAILGPIGIIVAAIIGKVNGVKASLAGWLIPWLVVGLIYAAIVGLDLAK